jgi:hypothetical protein
MNLLNCSLAALLATVFLAAGCGQFGDDKPHHKEVKSAPALFHPDVFVVAPDKIAGCSGLYTYDSLNVAFDNLDVDKGKKIFATKTKVLAFLRVHNQDVFLKYDAAESKAANEKSPKEIEIYKGSGYVAVLTLHMMNAEGEVVWKGGTLEITWGKQKVTIKIRGISGC